jgi:methyl acetate hydrolase
MILTRRHFAGLLLAASRASLSAAPKSLADILRDSMLVRGIPASAAVVVDATGVRYAGGFGTRDPVSRIPVTADTIFQIASMTKPIVSVAAMQLVEQGKATLDAPVWRHLPQLARPQVLEGFSASGEARLRPAASEITLRQLLTHTSGLAYGVWHPLMARYMAAQQLATVAVPLLPLVFDPGTAWQYGFSTDWVGRFVEAISGLNLQQYLRRHVLDPLGMTDTEFGVPPDKFDRSVTMYRRTPEGRFEARPRVQAPAPTEFNGGGGLTSTANDYAKFMRMILRRGLTGANGPVLQPATVRVMLQNHIGGLRAGVLASNQPNISRDVDTHPGSADKWGLGFLLHGRGRRDGRSEGSAAWAGLYNTYFWIDPRRGVAAAVMMQYLPFFDEAAIGLLADFERAVYTTL